MAAAIGFVLAALMDEIRDRSGTAYRVTRTDSDGL
jgi:hypothetical protein